MKKKSIKRWLCLGTAALFAFCCINTGYSSAEELGYGSSNTSDQASFGSGSEGIESEKETSSRSSGTWEQSPDGRWRYRYSNGTYATNTWEYINGKWYHFDSNGWMQTGWLLDGGKWYFLKPSTGAMVTGWYKVQQKWYFFKPSGAMVTGWHNVQGYTYFFDSEGEYHPSTRRALIVGMDRSCALDVDGWSSCLSEMTFKQEQFETVQTLVGPTEQQFRNKISSIMHDATESDITYLCITGKCDRDGNITIGKIPNPQDPENPIETTISGETLHSILEDEAGKVVLFLSCDYSGTIIDRGDSVYPDVAFMDSFINETRSGELAEDKYIVICSSESDELSASYPFENSSSYYSKANVIWLSAGGWDPLYNGNLLAMYADYNNNSIVSLDELNTYSLSHISEQHVVIYSEDSCSEFTIYARN